LRIGRCTSVVHHREMSDMDRSLRAIYALETHEFNVYYSH
jgi:hypothetical protein